MSRVARARHEETPTLPPSLAGFHRSITDMSTTQTETEPQHDGLTATVDSEPLADYIDTLDALVDEAVITLTDDGIQTIAVDPANVACVDTELDAAAFDTYQRNNTRQLGVRLGRLDDVVAFADDEPIDLSLNPETRKLEIDVAGMSYTLALIDPDMIRDAPDIPDDLDLEATVTFDVSELKRGIKAADMASDFVRFRCEPDNADSEALVIEAFKADKDEAALRLGRDDLESAELADVASSFSLDYLKDVTKALPSDATVTMQLGDSVPVKLNSELESADGRVLYMIAPRLNKDEGGA